MPWFHLGPAGDTFAGALGVAAATLVVGGSILLRWQRNRQQYLLAKIALEKGITDLAPIGPPEWVRSMRHGVMTLVLGLSLMLAGSGGAYWAHGALEQGPPEPATRPTAGEKPGPNPRMEAYHRAMGIHTASLTAIGCGAILGLLGLTRTALARSERRWSTRTQK